MITHSSTDPAQPTAHLVLCATARLAVALRQSAGRRATGQGLRHWPALDCRTPEQWLTAVRQEWALRGLCPHPTLAHQPMSRVQERWLWERLIGQRLGPEAPYLFDLAALARTAQEALALQLTWGVASGAGPLSAEQQQFQHWRADFERWCQQHGWATPQQLDAATLASLAAAQGLQQWPQQLSLSGFHRLNPLQQALAARMGELGVALQPWDEELPAPPIETASYPDPGAEIQAAARWAQQRLTADPGCRLAIVAPDLGELRQPLLDALEDALCPEALHPARAQQPRPFNVALGAPLAEQPLVGAALLLLQRLSDQDEPTQADWSALLRHPHWLPPEQAPARAQWEARMRRTLPPRASLAQLLEWAAQPRQRPPEAPADDWLQALRQLQTLRSGACASQRLPSAWSASVPDWLRQCGWLQGQRLTSHGFQAREAFFEALHELAAIDSCSGPVSWAQWLSALRALCHETIFQPQTEGEPRLQVLGMLEASGQRFDAVWVLGLHAAAWPPPARPNPLLSTQAQRRAACPSASAAEQSAFAQQVQQRLLRSAATLCLSWPRTQGGHPCEPSAWLLQAAASAASGSAPASYEGPLATNWVDGIVCDGSQAQRIEARLDARAPALAPEETVRGGSALLRAQALCPAWAYFEFRLHARGLEEPVDGLDERARGSLLHLALARLWTHLRDSRTLQALAAPGRALVVAQAVAEALQQRAADPDQPPLTLRRQRLEQARLQRLLLQWLALEARREAAFSVVAIEARHAIDLDGLALRLQIDRVDRLDDGRLLVIDYKSGSAVDTRNWAEARLTEPQLPLYATWGDLGDLGAVPDLDALPATAHPAAPRTDPVAGALFAKVTLKKSAWAGLVAHDALNPGGATVLDSARGRKRYPEADFPGWAEVLAHWRERLRECAAEIRCGEAAVRVPDEQGLRHCRLLALLRLDERRRQWQALRVSHLGGPTPGGTPPIQPANP